MTNINHGKLACFAAATFFFYNMLQVTLFNSIADNLIQFYNIDNTQLGLLSSMFFLANALFIIPNSALLDIFDTRKLSLTFLAIFVLPCFILPLSPNLYVGATLRFIQGFAGTISLLIGIRTAVNWFPKRSATAIGLISAFGGCGGLFSNIVLPFLTEALGWKNVLLSCGIVGLLCFAIMWQFFYLKTDENVDPIVQFNKTIESLKLFKNPQVLKSSFYVGLMSIPTYIIASLFGNNYLQEDKACTLAQSATLSSILFLGLVIGPPIFGWYSDVIASRKKPMIIGAGIALFASLPIIFVHQLNYGIWIVLFFALGFAASAQAISYPVIIESVHKKVAGIANGIAFFITNIVGAVVQPVFGFLISVPLFNHGAQYNYFLGMLLFPLAFIVCLLLASTLRETCCQIH